jgi:hypothetical protein
VQDIPEDPKTRLRFSHSHAEPRGTADDCSCTLFGTHALLSEGVENQTALAERKRQVCRAAGRCVAISCNADWFEELKRLVPAGEPSGSPGELLCALVPQTESAM